MKNWTAKKWIGLIVKLFMAVIVLAFLGVNSLTFFEFATPAEKWYFAYLGFGLTSGAVIGYIILLVVDADTSLKKTITLIMLLISVIGEALTAYFGMQIDVWQKAGFELTETDFTFMITAVEVLAIIHGLMMIVYFVGDKIVEILGDDDNDGIPNYRDKDYKRSKKQPKLQPVYNQNAPAPQHTLDELASVSGMTVGQMRAKFPQYSDFAAFASGQFDYISGKNMKRLYGEINPTSRQRQK